MADPTHTDPTELDPAEAAKKIQDAGIADETAAYVNGDADDIAEEADPEAHPS